MGETIKLKAADGFELSAYKAAPQGKPRGGLVVIQEIFGVNNHMRGVADGYARDGYLCIVPALFDRVRRGVELGYQEKDIAAGRELRGKITDAMAEKDMAAARDALAGAGKIGIVGYCWGGYLAWIAATRLGGLAGAIYYYGGGIGNVAEERPRCPVVMHFGEKDHAIPLSDAEKVRARNYPDLAIHIYPAGHGFNCDERGSHDAASAKTARERSLAFLRKHIG
jgi:carboxymethylenebutenolidase